MSTGEDVEAARYATQDARWTGPRLIALGACTLLVCLSVIYWMSTTTGCSLQIVP
ncbi:MAG: hypothetical protein ABTD50_04050 [Polyangiaceae bacterium]